MGCGCLMTPFEECAYLLEEFNNIISKRKEFMRKNMIIEKRKLDKKVLGFRIRIYKILEMINKNNLTKLEIQRLKELNDLFLILLTEESNINHSDNSNIEESKMIDDDEILIMNTNKINNINKDYNKIEKKQSFKNTFDFTKNKLNNV